jgi:hypothetical protein
MSNPTHTQIASCILNRLHNSFAFRDRYSKSDLKYNHHMSANISINLTSKLRDIQAYRSKADYKLVTWSIEGMVPWWSVHIAI